MPRMRVTLEGPQVILGPCPGCEIWTLDYSLVVAATDYASDENFAEHVEFILQEHLAECSGLRELVDTP